MHSSSLFMVSLGGENLSTCFNLKTGKSLFLCDFTVLQSAKKWSFTMSFKTVVTIFVAFKSLRIDSDSDSVTQQLFEAALLKIAALPNDRSLSSAVSGFHKWRERLQLRCQPGVILIAPAEVRESTIEKFYLKEKL